MSTTNPATAAAPLVSVILPVYNAGPYLAEAIESILNQTLRELELIIIDDLSTDDSLAVARRYQAQEPQRVQVLASPVNRSYADNRGHELARGRYIAKMDADDIALPQRLQVQADFLDAHPEVDLTSSFLEAFGASATVYEYPVSADEVRAFLLFNMPVGNPTVFFRRSLLTEKGLRYDEDILDTFGEDYEFIGRVAQVATIVNQPQVLLRYRTFPAAHKADVHARRTAKSSQIRERLLRQAGFAFSARELHVHNTIAHYPFELGDITLPEAHAWLESLARQNESLGYTAPDALRKVLAARWFWTCYHNPDPRTDNYRAYFGQALAADYQPAAKLRLKFWLKNKVLRHRNK
jgi:glycosyltransferase involved in cell wall biosynthesis